MFSVIGICGRSVTAHFYDVALRVQMHVTVQLDDHLLDECRELPGWHAVLCSLVRDLLRVSHRASRQLMGQRTSSSLPSILNCHAGIPSPVSGFNFASPSPVDTPPSAPCCHACPVTVWLKKIRSVRVVWPEVVSRCNERVVKCVQVQYAGGCPALQRVSA